MAILTDNHFLLLLFNYGSFTSELGQSDFFLIDMLSYEFNNEKQQRIANGIHRRHNPGSEGRIRNQWGIDVERIGKT